MSCSSDKDKHSAPDESSSSDLSISSLNSTTEPLCGQVKINIQGLKYALLFEHCNVPLKVRTGSPFLTKSSRIEDSTRQKNIFFYNFDTVL